MSLSDPKPKVTVTVTGAGTKITVPDSTSGDNDTQPEAADKLAQAIGK